MSQSNFWNTRARRRGIVSRHAFDVQAAEAYSRGRLDLGNYVPYVQVSIDGPVGTVTISACRAQSTPLAFSISRWISGYRQRDNVMEPI